MEQEQGRPIAADRDVQIDHWAEERSYDANFSSI